MTDEKTDAGAGEGTGGVSGDSSDANPDPDGQGGASMEELLEKVGKVVKEATGIDLSEVIAGREKAAAAAAAESSGVNAQKKYDPQMQELRNALQATRDELKGLKRTAREAKINAMPESARDAAKKIAEAEDVAEDAQATITFANQALRVSKARELALDLREKGVPDISKETFLDLDSPEAMDARAQSIRADFAETALKEALKGVKTPPAAASKPSRSGGGAGSGGGQRPGEKPWAAQAKKGLSAANLAAGLRAMEEADYTGER
ncbi:MAG: hypothetical protein ABIH46_03485 [Chloroflexota bacterium]